MNLFLLLYTSVVLTPNTSSISWWLPPANHLKPITTTSSTKIGCLLIEYCTMRSNAGLSNSNNSLNVVSCVSCMKLALMV